MKLENSYSQGLYALSSPHLTWAWHMVGSWCAQKAEEMNVCVPVLSPVPSSHWVLITITSMPSSAGGDY